VYISDDEVSLDIPVTLTNLVSFFQGMRLRYNDGQGTRDIVTFLGANFIDGMQLKCKIQKSNESEILVDLETLNFIENQICPCAILNYLFLWIWIVMYGSFSTEEQVTVTSTSTFSKAIDSYHHTLQQNDKLLLNVGPIKYRIIWDFLTRQLLQVY
jgi:hypothetical protein